MHGHKQLCHLTCSAAGASVSVCCAGGAVDLDLAVASTLGSGLFISCVMTASVVLIRTVDVVDTTAFVRDILAYMLANLLVLCFLWNGQLAAWEASLLILLYIVYVAVACYTSRSALFVLCLTENALVPMLCHSTERPHVCVLLGLEQLAIRPCTSTVVGFGL